MTLALSIALVLIASVSESKCSVLLPPPPINDELSDFVCQVAFASDARVTFVYLEDNDDELIRCLFSRPLPVVLTLTSDLVHVESIRNSSSVHIISFGGGPASERLLQFKGILDARIRRRRQSKYILVFRVPCEEQLALIFRSFWESGVLDVVAVCGLNEVFSYEPFTRDGFRVTRVSPAGDLFYDKLKNLHHFQLRISQFYNPLRSIPEANHTRFRGIDGRLAMTIVEKLNATVRFLIPAERYGVCENGTLTGTLGEVVSGAAHAGFNARTIDTRYDGVEYIQPLGKRSYFHLLVPKSPMVPQYLNFIRVFNRFTWCVLLLNFIFFGIVFAGIQATAVIIGCEPCGSFGASDIVEMLFKTAIGNPVDRFHRISSLRQLLIGWIFFSYIISSIYLAKMESVFVQPEYEEDMDSLSEIPHLKVPIYTSLAMLDLVKLLVDPKDFAVIESKLRLLPANYEPVVLKMVKLSQDNAFILRRDRANTLIANSFNYETRRPTYHLMKEYLFGLVSSYMVTKGSPFFEKFQILHAWCFEHGLLNHFEAEETHLQKVRREVIEMDEDEEETDDRVEVKKRAVILSMNILQGAFYVWIIGIGGGSLVFVAELFAWHQEKNGLKEQSVELIIE